MNRKDISEIRRRFDPERINSDVLRGCYVDEKKNIICTFSRSLQIMSEEETEKYLALFKKVCSGQPGRNLVSIPFRADQVTDGDQHKLLMSLRATALKVDQAVDAFFQRVTESLEIEGNYVILLLHDCYDVPFRAKDEYKVDDGSDSMFSYFVCAVCPVKLSKGALCYSTKEQTFCEQEQQWLVSAPEIGFMFPAFEDGGANIYEVNYYSRDVKENHGEFIDAVFGSAAPMPPAEQKEVFEGILAETLEDDCNLEVIQTVHEQMRDIIEEQKTDKTAEPPTISKHEVSNLLSSCGVSDSHVAAFEERFDEEFGVTGEVCVKNLTNTGKMELRTPDVVVQVNPERSDLVQTRIIDGEKYILIRANEGVEVNGVSISIADLGEEVD